MNTFTPMLASPGSVARLNADQWAFEGKFDGYRLIMEADHGHMRLLTRRGNNVTSEYPQLRLVAADLADHQLVLDGEAVALDAAGVPVFSEIQNRARAARVEYWVFDLLSMDGHSLLRVPYQGRRDLLEALAETYPALTVPGLLPSDGCEALGYARAQGWEGVVAKDRDSAYYPGKRSPLWLKDKFWRTQEIVIGGWRVGEGSRADRIGSLLMGIPDKDGLQFVGRVGTGFTDAALDDLKKTLEPFHTANSPFNRRLPTNDARGATFVEPVFVGEVQYADRTVSGVGVLRQPSWRGLRPDKEPEEVQ